MLSTESRDFDTSILQGHRLNVNVSNYDKRYSSGKTDKPTTNYNSDNNNDT